MGLMSLFQPLDSLGNRACDHEVGVESSERQGFGPTDRDQSVPVSAGLSRRQGVKQRLNWTVLAGGAFATAVSVAFCRKRQRSCTATDFQPTKTAKVMAVPDTECEEVKSLSVAHEVWHMQFPRTPLSVTETMRPAGKTAVHEFGCDDHGPAYPPTPQVKEHIRVNRASEESKDTPTLATPPYRTHGGDSSMATPITPQNWEKQDFIVSSHGNRSAKPNMLHRLRQQVKSRDEMLLEVHAQVKDQERMIRLQEAERRELEGRVQVINRSLHEAEVEIRRLTKALSCCPPISDQDSFGHLRVINNAKLGSHGELLRNFVYSSNLPQQSCQQQQLQQQQQELVNLASEVQKMAGQLKDVEKDRNEHEMCAALKHRENELLVIRLKEVEAELEGAKKLIIEKDNLLQHYQTEIMKITEATSMKGHVLTAEAGRTEQSTETTSMGPQSTDSKSVRDSRLVRRENRSRPVAKSFTSNRDVVRSYNVLFATTPQLSFEDGCPVQTQTEDAMELEEDGEIIETLLVALQDEVDQLSTVLEKTSNAVYNSQGNQVLDDVESEEYLFNHPHFQVTAEELGASLPEDEQDWEELSHFLSLSKGITSAAQVQELSHKLEQVARQQRVEEIQKRHNRIAELKQRVERLNSRVNCSRGADGDVCEATEEQANRLASLSVELDKKLTLQEEQACSEAHDLSNTANPFRPAAPPGSKIVEKKTILNNSYFESEVTFSESWHGRTSASAEYGSRIRYSAESEESTLCSNKAEFDNSSPFAEFSPFQSPATDRKFSSLNIEDSPAVRIGSPTIAGDVQSPLVQSCAALRDDSRTYGSQVKVEIDGPGDLSGIPSTSLSPFSKMMARLEWNQAAKASRLTPHDLEDFGRRVLESYGSSQVQAIAEVTSLTQLQTPTSSASCTGSLDSSLDEMLDNTLEDLVRVCSEANTPSTSPAVSTASSDTVQQNEDLRSNQSTSAG